MCIVQLGLKYCFELHFVVLLCFFDMLRCQLVVLWSRLVLHTPVDLFTVTLRTVCFQGKIGWTYSTTSASSTFYASRPTSLRSHKAIKVKVTFACKIYSFPADKSWVALVLFWDSLWLYELCNSSRLFTWWTRVYQPIFTGVLLRPRENSPSIAMTLLSKPRSRVCATMAKGAKCSGTVLRSFDVFSSSFTDKSYI